MRLLRIKKVILLFCLTVISGLSFGQQFWLNGRIPSKYYSDKDFGSSPQILTGTQDKNGLVYFGNNQRIIGFNGADWFKVQLEPKGISKEQASIISNSVVQVLFTDSKGTTLVGRDNNFGKIAYSDSGFIRYFPLHIGKKEGGFGRIKHIYEVDVNDYLLVAENGFFKLKNDKAESIELPQRIKDEYGLYGSVQVNGGLIITLKSRKSTKEKLIYYFYDSNSSALSELELPEHINLQNPRGSIEINGKTIIFDLQGRIFTLRKTGSQWIWNQKNEEILPTLSNFSILSVKKYNDLIFVGTDAQGLMILNLNGEIIRHFDLQDGLLNTTVNALFQDSESNIWLCLDNGIHFIEFSSPLSSYEKDKGISSNVQSLSIYKNEILAATTIDLAHSFKKDFNLEFENQSLFKEALFNIRKFSTDFGDRYLVVGYNGLYEYFPETKTKFSIAGAYGWKLFQSPANRNIIYVGLDNGIGELTIDAKGITYRELLVGLGGDVIQITGNKEKLYFGVHSKGVCIYDIASGDHKIVPLKSDYGAKSYYYSELFKNKLYVGCISGIYTLNEKKQVLEPFKEIDGRFLGSEDFQIHRLMNENDERLWIIFHDTKENQESKKETGYLEISNGKYQYNCWSLIGLKQAGIANDILFPNKNEIVFAGLNGVYVYKRNHKLSPDKMFSVLIDAFLVNNKIVSGNPLFSGKLSKINHDDNTVKVIFHAGTFSGLDGIEYAYKLQGFTEEWSEYSAVNSVNFPKLSEGEYKLLIKARNAYGFESEISSIEFSVLPPWYRTWWAYSLYVLTLFIFIYIIIRISTQRVKNQNIKLEHIVQERTHEIAEQNKLLEKQKSEITLKTNDILDSIKYAKRIQDTILPAEIRLNELFREHFVFYRPKDIVSGDFYWAREIDDLIYFSAIDCTGHGVPGALVSIVGNNSLLRTINEFRIREPHQILDKLRELVVNAFLSQGQVDVKDGMDIALVCIDKKNKKLKFSGANNECIIIRNKEIVELAPDKQPIGQFTHAKPFTQKEFDIESGDCIYMFTDGFVDQFGGEREKKYKSRPFKNLLIRISHLPMEEQLTLIAQEFDSWKGNLEQIDDVCVFGVKI